MTKPGPGPDESKTGAHPVGEDGPSPELIEQFRRLEARVDEAVRLIAQLRQEKQQLATRLEETARARNEAVRRIDELIDKIDGLL